MSLHIKTSAHRDLANNAEYIRRDNPRAALRFLEAAEAGFQLLLTMPELGTPYKEDVPEFAGIRFSIVKSFSNYVIYYRPSEEGVEILRVLHGARDAEVLLGRDLS